MIEFWIDLPISARYATLAVVGLLLGSFANWGIYTFAYFPRPISPWSRRHPDAPPRRALDRLPVIGWLGLRRERYLHGTGFWIRPLLIEVGMAVLACLLYKFESLDFSLLTTMELAEFQQLPGFTVLFSHWMNYLFFCHLLLLVLMTMATFIDFDERTVPDFITVPGTLLGLILSAISYEIFLPYVLYAGNTFYLEPTLLTAPFGVDPWFSTIGGLLLGLSLFAGWCFAIADRRVILRRGWRKGIEFFLAGLVRNPAWKLLVTIWSIGSVGILIVWLVGGSHWSSLLSGLSGMAIGGGSVWAVRIAAGHALRQEAMGFGDVTLMAMIGTFIGWQASLIAFALAPMTAIVIVLAQYALTRNRVVAFGPYLCAGTIVTILFWPLLWNEFGVVAFGLGPKILFTILISLLLIMWAMLLIWGWIKRNVFGIG